jgi:hypothetical protein
MATLTATKAKTRAVRPAVGAAGNMKAQFETYTLSANVTAADILEMFWLPANATVIGGWLYADDIDTGIETLDIDVGFAGNGVDTADPDAFGNFGVLTGDAVTGIKPETGTSMPLGGLLITAGPQKFTVPTKIQLVFNVAAATFASGEISLVMYYVVND